MVDALGYPPDFILTDGGYHPKGIKATYALMDKAYDCDKLIEQSKGRGIIPDLVLGIDLLPEWDATSLDILSLKTLTKSHLFRLFIFESISAGGTSAPPVSVSPLPKARRTWK